MDRYVYFTRKAARMQPARGGRERGARARLRIFLKNTKANLKITAPDFCYNSKQKPSAYFFAVEKEKTDHG